MNGNDELFVSLPEREQMGVDYRWHHERERVKHDIKTGIFMAVFLGTLLLWVLTQ